MFARIFGRHKCSECGSTDSTVQWSSGLCARYVCPTCILQFGYDYYMPSLRGHQWAGQ